MLVLFVFACSESTNPEGSIGVHRGEGCGFLRVWGRRGGCLGVKGVGGCRALVGLLGWARAVVGALKTFNSFNSLKTFNSFN